MTARKREGALQSVPISVTACTAESIEPQGIGNVQDVAKFTRGLSWDKGFAPRVPAYTTDPDDPRQFGLRLNFRY